jgi:(p)ppGpp synthase/HD superfamily hydrolase
MKNDWSIDDLQEVWHLVAEMHNGQKYGGQKDGQQVEYISHIGSVTFEILNAINHENEINADLAIKCALLHDIIEDTEFSFEEVEAKFGKSVANGVSALTKDEKGISDKNAQMLDSLTRIKLQPKEVWLVKMADRICNLYAPPFYWSNDKKEKYAQEATLIYNELHEASQYLAERLSKKIEQYKTYID